MDDKNPFVFLEFSFNNVKGGRVVIELLKNIVPKTAENFRALCTGEKGIGINGKPLHYIGAKVHRVVPKCMIQAGDIINGDGTSGESIYGQHFEVEKLSLKHDREGLVGMSNNGKDKNSSQFYITTFPCPQLDDTNVIFGKVVKGLDVVKEIAEMPRFNDVPLENITISNCGEFKDNEPWNMEENDGTLDVYPSYPSDWDKKCDDKLIKKVVNDINSSGNHYFYKQDFLIAESKYKKLIRYIDWYLKKNKSLTELLAYKINAQLNMTAVRLKIDKNKEALELCSEIIKSHPNNGKAFYRRARARLALKDYDEALDDLKIAYTLHPNDKHIRNMFEITKNKKISYLKKEKRFCLKVFNK